MAGRLRAKLQEAAGRRSGPPRRRGLDARWEEIELLERLQPPLSAPVAQRRPGEAQRARRELTPLKRWEKISERSFGTYVGDANHVRLHRLLQFVRDGDRVLDVGMGYGYVTAMLHRERRLAAYWGIDLREQFADAARDALLANGLDPSAAELEVKSVLDLDAAWMEARRPDLALVLEVLEHIPDPAAALRALATTLPEHAVVLFTVPILGRLDGVWGHISLFDRGRIEAVCAQAGLTIHYVEPVHATWVLVAASPGTRTPARLAPLLDEVPPPPLLLRGAARGLARPALSSYSVRSVYVGGSRDYRRPHHDPEHVEVKANLTGVYCRVSAGAEPATGGVRLPIADPAFLRVEFSCEGAEHVEEISVLGLDGQERVCFGWTYRPSRLNPYDGAKRSHLLRPGRPTRRFSPWATAETAEAAAARALDVRIRVRGGGSSRMRVHRVAFAGPDPETLSEAGTSS